MEKNRKKVNREDSAQRTNRLVPKEIHIAVIFIGISTKFSFQFQVCKSAAPTKGANSTLCSEIELFVFCAESCLLAFSDFLSELNLLAFRTTSFQVCGSL